MNYDVLIIGAGSAGVGIANILQDCGVESMLVVDKDEVGASFFRWPAEMRFITPSFTSNFFAQMDLNSIAQGTSPAYTLRTEHPTGAQYAEYLQGVVDYYELPVKTGVNVFQIDKVDDEFLVRTNKGILSARFCIWAGGEFNFPNQDSFPGAELCQHNSFIESYRDLQGDEFWIIGGYESGMDAAVNLCHLGKEVHVIDRDAKWNKFSTDPSVNISTFTYERIKEALETKRLHLHGGHQVNKVEIIDGKYNIHTHKKDVFVSKTMPIMGTGFKSSGVINDLFNKEEGDLLLNEVDESTRTENLFLVGPQVRQEGLIFCFIYKFRQRFGVVAKAISERLGLDVSEIEDLRQDGLFMDDLSCCGEECDC